MMTSSTNGFSLRWAEGFSEPEIVQIVELMNSIIEQESIIGYAAPIDPETGHRMISELGREAAQAGCHVLLGYDQDQRVAGMVILRQNKQPNCRHLAELSKGIISPRMRARGLLRAALLQIVERCRVLGVDVLTLDVRAGTRSERLWRALGFEPYGRLEDYARVDQQVHAGVFMFQYVNNLLKNLPAV